MQLQLILNPETKQCSKCGSQKIVADFYKDKSRRDGLYGWCKSCCLLHQKKRWRDSPEVRADHKAAQRRRRLKELGEIVGHDRKRRANILNGERQDNRRLFAKMVKTVVGCQSCGERESAVLDFHHIDPSTKSFIISRQARDSSMERLIEEIMKCCCVCANCHRKHHFNVMSLNGIPPISEDQIDQAKRAIRE